MSIQTLLSTALAKRHDFLQQAEQDKTDCFRVFHGTVEGVSGLNVDRYGDNWLVQSFHQTLTAAELAEIVEVLTQEVALPVVYNDRSAGHSRVLNALSAELDDIACAELVMQENGIKFTTKLRHEGQDPLLFLDMRIGREYVRAHSQDKTVLNLFS